MICNLALSMTEFTGGLVENNPNVGLKAADEAKLDNVISLTDGLFLCYLIGSLSSGDGVRLMLNNGGDPNAVRDWRLPEDGI